MPTITLSFDVTEDQETKARNWWSNINEISGSPHASMEEFLENEVIHQVRAGIREQERPPNDIEWNELTDDQRSRIKAIVNE